MAKKSVVLTISVWDKFVRLSLINKTFGVNGELTFELSVQKNDHGISLFDPFEIIYYVRTGVQQLLLKHSVSISNICIAVMPGSILAWDTDTCSPLTECVLSNNSLPTQLFKEFKYSSFYHLLSEHPDLSSIDYNLSISLWYLSKYMMPQPSQHMMISGLDTWLNYFLTGFLKESLVTPSDMVSELLFSGDGWDEPLLKTLGLNLTQFPEVKDSVQLVTKGFSPLEDGIPLLYTASTVTLVSQMMKSFSNQPIACIHLSHVNHVYIENMVLPDQKPPKNHWIRMVSWDPFYGSFNVNGHRNSSIDLEDISDDMAIPLDPFKSFDVQKYHLLNVQDFGSKNMGKLGVLQSLFLIKYCMSSFDHKSQNGHIQQMIISASEWNPAILQLCIDLCQIDGIDFSIPHWLDLIHSCQCVRLNQFFSESSQQSLFKIKQQYLTGLDPLTSYSLYQEWEYWFNKLYDNWH